MSTLNGLMFTCIANSFFEQKQTTQEALEEINRYYAETDDEKQIIEKIDIGGPSMIRAAAKNFKDVAVLAK